MKNTRTKPKSTRIKNEAIKETKKKQVSYKPANGNTLANCIDSTQYNLSCFSPFSCTIYCRSIRTFF